MIFGFFFVGFSVAIARKTGAQHADIKNFNRFRLIKLILIILLNCSAVFFAFGPNSGNPQPPVGTFSILLFFLVAAGYYDVICGTLIFFFFPQCSLSVSPDAKHCLDLRVAR
jgi:hypothetical protein